MKSILYLFTLLTCFSPLTVGSQDLSSGLLLHYPLDGSVEDASANNLDGMAQNITYAEDRSGQAGAAARFGGNGHIDFPANPGLKTDLPVSLSFWVYPENVSVGGQALLSTDFVPGAFHGLTVGVDDSNRVTFTLRPEGEEAVELTAQSRLFPGRWHHLALVVEAPDRVWLYADGCRERLQAENPLNALGYSAEGRGSLGRGNAGSPPQAGGFAGRLDDFYYWNRVLSAAEIYSLYGDFHYVEIELESNSVCPGDTVRAVAVTTFGGAGVTYSWTSSPAGLTLLSPDSAATDIATGAPGTYVVQVKVRPEGSPCFWTGTDTLVVGPLDLMIRGDTLVCYDEEFTLEASTPVPAAITWLEGPDGPVLATGPTFMGLSQNQDFVYYVRAETEICSALDSFLVRFSSYGDPLDILEASGFYSADVVYDVGVVFHYGCPGCEVPVALNPEFMYQWSPLENIDAEDPANPVFTVDPGERQEYTLFITTPEGCPATGLVFIFPCQIFISVDTSVTYEPGELVMLEVINQDPLQELTYQWEPAAAVDDPTAAVVTVNPALTEQLQLVVSDQYGCSDTVYIRLIPDSSPSFQGDPPGEPVALESSWAQERLRVNLFTSEPDVLEWRVVNAQGQVLSGASLAVPAGRHSLELPTGRLHAGLYFLHLDNGRGKGTVRRFVVPH